MIGEPPLFPFLGDAEPVVGLEVLPERWRAPEDAPELERRLGRDRSLAMDNLADRLRRPATTRSQLGLRHASDREVLFEHFAGRTA